MLITKDEIYVAHAGDSRAVFLKNNDIVYETKDHKPSDPEEYERITKNGGFVGDGRIN